MNPDAINQARSDRRAKQRAAAETLRDRARDVSAIAIPSDWRTPAALDALDGAIAALREAAEGLRASFPPDEPVRESEE